MLFRPSDSNIKLKAPDDTTPHYAVSALEALNRDGAHYQIVSKPSTRLPDEDGFLFFPSRNHFQGIAIRDSYALATTSAEGGAIVAAKGYEETFLLDSVTSAGGFEHPGGVQTVGSYLAVPVYDLPSDNRQTELRFYRYGPQIEWASHLTIKRRDKRFYCAGVTNCSSPEGEYYLLAVVSHNEGDIVEFYRTEPGLPLSDRRCSFVKAAERGSDDHTPYKTWSYESVRQNPQNLADWQPDRNWGGYPNSISLLADDAGQVYFLGLHRSRSGRDWADLFLLDIEAPQGRMLRKLANFHAIAKEGASFRFGGSALVTSKTTFSIFACARNAENSDQELALNVFHANHDPMFGQMPLTV